MRPAIFMSALLAAVGIAVLLTGCAEEVQDGEPGVIAGARVLWNEPPDGKPLAVLMLIHGGGWKSSNQAFEVEQQNGRDLRKNGYATVAIAYDDGTEGFDQILAVYREARRRYPDIPLCAAGSSAGGHLSLMVAAREPGLDCVLAIAAPTDLAALARPVPAGAGGQGARATYEAALAAFGHAGIEAFSPVRYADRIKAKVLLVAAESDPLVPVSQSREFARALPQAGLVVLPAGPNPAPFAHYGGVQPDALGVLLKNELEFLDDVTSGRRPVGSATP